MSADGLVFTPVRRLAELVRERRLSPVTLAETVLERLERLGSRYNAVVTVTRERALEQARRAEGEIAAGRYRGPLHGIPYGAKDLLATSGGIPTTWGAALPPATPSSSFAAAAPGTARHSTARAASRPHRIMRPSPSSRSSTPPSRGAARRRHA